MSYSTFLKGKTAPTASTRPDNRAPKTAVHGLILGLLVLSVLTVSLGAYTRLANAGLGCPDWPGCYGHLVWPTSSSEIAAANQAFPETPVDQHKTWPEMVHRYLAGLLGFGIFMVMACCYIKKSLSRFKTLSTLLGLLVFFQALLGMWTVTLKLWPQIVTLHLFGGFSTVALLFLAWLTLRDHLANASRNHHHPIPKRHAKRVFNHPDNFLFVSTYCLLIFVVLQLGLGAWTSANYAAMACHDFPTCQGRWVPPMALKTGFMVWQSQGPNYLGGQLDGEARVAIHWVHRLGALGVWSLSMVVSGLFLKQKRFGQAVFLLSSVHLQIALGIVNIFYSWPLSLAVAHNLGALLLLLSVVFCLYKQRQRAAFSGRTPPAPLSDPTNTCHSTHTHAENPTNDGLPTNMPPFQPPHNFTTTHPHHPR